MWSPLYSARELQVSPPLPPKRIREVRVGFFFFDRQILSPFREVEWGGMPNKADNNGVLNPRASFAAWRDIRKGYSVPWKEYLLKAAER